MIALHRSSQDYIVEHNGASPINAFQSSLPDSVTNRIDVTGPSSGLWAANVEPGEWVSAGSCLGELLSVDKPQDPAQEVVAQEKM